MTAPEYQPDTAVLAALALIGLALAGSMFYVLVFPAKPKPISCSSSNVTCITIPSGISVDSTLNFISSNVTISAGSYVQWKNLDESPHTVTATHVPAGASKFDSGELDDGNTFYVQLTVPGVYDYHCMFHPLWMRGTIIVTS
jgi:plastocyanin